MSETLLTAEPIVTETATPNPEDYIFEGESEQTEPEQVEKAPTLPPHGREAKFELNGKEYVATEEMLKKHYGINDPEPFTEKEFKTVLASYKAAMQSNAKNRQASQIAKQVEEAFQKLYEDPKTTLRQLYKDKPAH